MNVDTNMGGIVLGLLDKHFPKGHVLHSVLNRSTVKVSYRCLPNMGAQVAKHNAKILKNSKGGQNKQAPSCNCQKSRISERPLHGRCNTNGVVYQAIVRSNTGGEESYIGLAKNFKKRFRQHKASMTDKKSEGATTLSSHFWKVKESGGDPPVELKLLEKNIPTFNPVRGCCMLCLREK